MKIDWKAEVVKRKEDLLKETQGLLQIRSVLDEEHNAAEAPFGEGIAEALNYMMKLGHSAEMTVKNVEGYAAHLEMGQGEELVGILGHLDVVPEGDGWSVDPFGGEIKDGKLYARGAIDDKGPTMAAFYAMKIVQELKLPLSKRVRLILGTDEESQWRCVKRYFESEEMPSIGFAPDADFPIIHAEKGMLNVEWTGRPNVASLTGDYVLQSFHSGRRLNMVPDVAEAVISGDAALCKAFDAYLAQHQAAGSSEVKGERIHLTLQGKSAHGSTPEFGINAGVMLAQFLSTQALDEAGKQYVTFVATYVQETQGVALGIASEDEVSGPLTVNAGVFSYEHGKSTIGLNVRYPVQHDGDQVLAKMQQLASDHAFDISIIKHTRPHFIDENHTLVQTLRKVYEEQTGLSGKPIAIGGGTYARSLKAGVAFGALFPGREDVAHQKDEYMFVEDLINACAIYAEAIYELAR
ncbi:dipeptidase PepV [Fictibacillus macauensis ZFHKF-1]|uniref:Dipeptidase PepV n=2 Tax=Fictibacillus TaxID=1329200 RepID=I8UFD4_9BACL|nr:dipeptidase PepV [Fictibacillus macauensis ZFHKF-1]